MLLITEVLILQADTHTLSFRTSMHAGVKTLAISSRSDASRPREHFQRTRIPSPCRASQRRGIPGDSKIRDGAKHKHFISAPWLEPPHLCRIWGVQPAETQHPRLDPHNHLPRSGFGESRRWCPGRDAPERRGGCSRASLAGSQAERAGLEIIQSAIKTPLSKQGHLYGKLWKKTPPLVPNSEGRAMQEQVWDDQVKLAQLPQNPPGISKAGAEGAQS